MPHSINRMEGREMKRVTNRQGCFFGGGAWKPRRFHGVHIWEKTEKKKKEPEGPGATKKGGGKVEFKRKNTHKEGCEKRMKRGE